MGSLYEFQPNFLIPGCKQTRGASGHLGLVMAKLAEINFNLERAECTWPRTLWDGRSFIVVLIAPNWIDRMTCMCKLYAYLAVAHCDCSLTNVGSFTKSYLYIEQFLLLLDVYMKCKKMLLLNITYICSNSLWMNVRAVLIYFCIMRNHYSNSDKLFSCCCITKTKQNKTKHACITIAKIQILLSNRYRKINLIVYE